MSSSRPTRTIRDLAFLLAPILVIVLVWLPVLDHYAVDGPAVRVRARALRGCGDGPKRLIQPGQVGDQWRSSGGRPFAADRVAPVAQRRRDRVDDEPVLAGVLVRGEERGRVVAGTGHRA